ncbi:MAG: hypothetical protein HQL43_15000 [Alphaproteobacteria bacterium]|nr:hypothetical protein [Alphaproteobacteria bacterium]
MSNSGLEITEVVMVSDAPLFTLIAMATRSAPVQKSEPSVASKMRSNRPVGES